MLTAEAELEHKNITKRVKGKKKKKIIIEQDSITERTKTAPKKKKSVEIKKKVMENERVSG